MSNPRAEKQARDVLTPAMPGMEMKKAASAVLAAF
jgi:hypothetical protein